MKISIIGAGCVGSVIAKHISDAFSTKNLRFIAEGEYAERLKSDGVIVNDKVYDISILTKEEEKPDLIFVCVKNFHLEQACLDIEKYIGKQTIILPLLNSVSPTPTIKEFFPENRVLYGYINKIDCYKNGDGYKYNIPGDIHFGYENNDIVAKELKEIYDILNKAGFSTYIDKDMIRGVWRKWMLNVGANQVSALTEANYIQFSQIDEIEQVIRLAMHELLIIASYEKVNLSTKDIEELITYLTTYPYPKKTSMLQDVLARRKTEIDYISGDVLTLSRKWNYPCPVNLTMYYLIKSKEKAYL